MTPPPEDRPTPEEAGAKSLREKIEALKCKKIDPARSFSDKAWNNAIDACLMVLTEHEGTERGRDEELAKLRDKVLAWEHHARYEVNDPQGVFWTERFLAELAALTAEGRAGEGEK